MEREKTVKTEKEEARRRYTPFTGFPNTVAPKIYSPKNIGSGAGSVASRQFFTYFFIPTNFLTPRI